VLGQHDVNISRMQMGHESGGRALAIFNLSTPLTDAAFQQVAALDGIEIARSVE
jgi:hypothetical protein